MIPAIPKTVLSRPPLNFDEIERSISGIDINNNKQSRRSTRNKFGLINGTEGAGGGDSGSSFQDIGRAIVETNMSSRADALDNDDGSNSNQTSAAATAAGTTGTDVPNSL